MNKPSNSELFWFLQNFWTGMTHRPIMLTCPWKQTCARARAHTHTPHPADVHEEILKQLPHVITCVNLLHLHLSVHIAVIQEVDVSDLNLKGESSSCESPAYLRSPWAPTSSPWDCLTRQPLLVLVSASFWFSKSTTINLKTPKHKALGRD